MGRKGQPATLEEKDRYVQYRQMGATITEAAARVGRSRSWAHDFETSGQIPVELKAKFPGGKAAHRKAELTQQPIPRDRLDDRPLRALEDFEMFRRVYIGRRSTPWQVEAGERLRELLASEHKEFVVINCPPGAGKSALLRDIKTWLIARDRSVRTLMGSRTERQARQNSDTIRKLLARRSPVQAKDEERSRGLAVDAEAALAVDYGPFRPTANSEIWRREMFTVVQAGETSTDEKESTVTAFGMDSGQLGWRVNGVFWDDLVDTSQTRNVDAIERLEQWYDDEAETRLEPGGLLVLCGQRLASSDLYRYCLDKPAFSEVTEIDLEGDPDVSSMPRKYHHIVRPAHDEERCEGVHAPADARPWPDGCLLDPWRLPWKELVAIKADPKRGERKFRVLYQQEDTDPDAVLVPKLWVNGGRDPATGEEFVGCWDAERRIGELPDGLRPPLVSVATADPSPTKFWAIEWFVWQPSTGLVFLMDLERRAMDAPDFLDWNEQDRSFSGVMQEWQRRSRDLGVPISCWVVEQNCAQRFILQYDHFRRWQRHWGVRVIGHETSRNKADAEFGMEASIQPVFRRGLIRLPGSQDGVTRTAAMKLVDEATRYPDSATDDTLMALWFFLFTKNRGLLAPNDPGRQPRGGRPGFVKEAA